MRYVTSETARGRLEPGLLFLGVLASRLPFVWGPVGTDYDNALLRLAALITNNTGMVHVSRPPGYPLFELLMRGLVIFPASATHLANAVLAGLAAVGLYLAAKALDRPAPLWIAAIGSVVPVAFVNSINGMDYMAAWCLMTFALWSAITDRVWLAGIFLGLAIGCRVGSLFVGAPLLFFLIKETADRPKLIQAGLVAVLLGGLQFAPILAAYGGGILTFIEGADLNATKVFYSFGPGVWGESGGIAVLMLVALAIFPPGFEIKTRIRTEWPLYAAIGVNLAMFARLPLESGYLLPVTGLLLLALGQGLTGRLAVAVGIAMLLGNIIGVTRDFRIAGKVTEEVQRREVIQRRVHWLDSQRPNLPPNAVLVLSFYQPYWELRKTNRTTSDSLAIPLALQQDPTYSERLRQENGNVYRTLTREQFDVFRAQGRPIYIVSDITTGDLSQMGYDPFDRGAIRLNFP